MSENNTKPPDLVFAGKMTVLMEALESLPFTRYRKQDTKPRQIRNDAPIRCCNSPYSSVKRLRLSSFPRPAWPNTLPFSTTTSPRESTCVGHPVTLKPS
jgi:hypothetical protein